MQTRIFRMIVLVSISLLFIFDTVSAGHPVTAPRDAYQVWDIQRVDDVHMLTEYMGDHAAVYDAAGTLHVAYGVDHLYYARCVGVSCTIEVVDDTDYVGKYASLALDSHGYPHIAYYDTGMMDFCNDEKVRYAAWDGSQWHIDLVDEGCLGNYPSIALDAQDVPHISYFNESSDDMMLADWDGDAWHTYTPYWLPGFGYSGYPSSLLSDSQGRLHLAFIAGAVGGGGTLWYTRKIGDAWEPLVELDTLPGATRLSMVLDGNGNPHLAYYHHHYDDGLSLYVSKLRYIRFDGSAWLGMEEITDMDYLAWTSVLVGTDGYPRIAYRVNGAAALIGKTAAGWGTPAAIPGTDNVERMYLGQAASDTLGLTFFSRGNLFNVTNAPPSLVWSAPSEIDKTGYTAEHIAMAASPAGDLHVVYTDYYEKQLRYAHRPAGGAWQIETLLEAGDDLLIRATDIDLDNSGRPNIVYQEYNEIDQRSALEYLFWTGSAWGSMEDVHQPLHNGCTPSLDLDGSNTIYIAFNDCDYIHENLMLAIYDGTWSYQTIDPDGDTTNPSLYVDEQGFYYVSYAFYGYPGSKVRFASKQGGMNWTIEDVADGSPSNTSLVLDSTGKPRIAYVVEENYDYLARLAAWDGQQWLVDTLTSTLYWSQASLAIDAEDRLHYAFVCQYHLCYAVKDGDTWTITDPVDRHPADPDEDFGMTKNLAIGLSSAGLPVIVYQGELDLKAAWLAEQELMFLPVLTK
jgi:hypothetical protein